MAKSEEGSSTKSGEGKYEGLDQFSFEKKMQKDMLNVVKRTDKLAKAKYAGGVDLDNIKDVKGAGVAGQDQLLAESKAAAKKAKPATKKKGGN